MARKGMKIMRRFNITVNGNTYEVDVEEVGGAAATAAPVQTAAPAVSAAPTNVSGSFPDMKASPSFITVLTIDRNCIFVTP